MEIGRTKKFIGLILALACLFAAMPAAVSANDSLVWKVQPQLPHSQISFCICGNYVDGNHRGLDIKTGQFNAQRDFTECIFGGGSMSRWLYDEKKDIFLHYFSSDYGEENRVDIIPRASLDNPAYALPWNRGYVISDPMYALPQINVFRKVDSDKIKEVRTNYDGWEYVDYDLSNAYIGTKYAIAYGSKFLTDFIYDIDNMFIFDNYMQPNKIIALKENNKWGIITKDGVIIPFIFDDIILIDNDTAFAKYNGKYGILDVTKTAPLSGVRHINATFGSTRYILNGEPFDESALVYNGVAYLPAAYLAAKLGLSARWDAATNITTLTSTGAKPPAGSGNTAMPPANPVTRNIKATFGGTKYILNGELLDEPTLVYNGVAYLPAAYLAAKLGLSASWDAKTNITTLTSR